MSDFHQSAGDLLRRINKYIDSKDVVTLSPELCVFINDEYNKEKENIIKREELIVEEVNFHNLTTANHLEKLWEILHQPTIIKRGRVSKKPSPIDVEVLEALRSSTNNVITGFEPIPNPEFRIGGYKIPENVTFEGVKRGRKPASFNNYSFAVSYRMNQLDDVINVDSNNVVNINAVDNSVNVVSDPDIIIDSNVDNICDSVINNNSVVVGESVNVDNSVVINSPDAADSVNIVCDKVNPVVDSNNTVSNNVAEELPSVPVINDNIPVIDVSIIDKLVIKKPIVVRPITDVLENNEYDKESYSIEILKKKVVVNTNNNNMSKPMYPNVMPLIFPVSYPDPPKKQVKPSVFDKLDMSVYNRSAKPVVKQEVKQGFKPLAVLVPSPILLLSPSLLVSSNLSSPEKPKEKAKRGRPLGSPNKTPEQREEERMNRKPRGRPKGSPNKKSKKTDEEVIVRDNSITLSVKPNKFEVHMIKYTLDKPEVCYAEWTNHSTKIIDQIYKDNKILAKNNIDTWDKICLRGIERIKNKLIKSELDKSDKGKDKIVYENEVYVKSKLKTNVSEFYKDVYNCLDVGRSSDNSGRSSSRLNDILSDRITDCSSDNLDKSSRDMIIFEDILSSDNNLSEIDNKYSRNDGYVSDSSYDNNSLLDTDNVFNDGGNFVNDLIDLSDPQDNCLFNNVYDDIHLCALLDKFDDDSNIPTVSGINNMFEHNNKLDVTPNDILNSCFNLYQCLYAIYNEEKEKGNGYL